MSDELVRRIDALLSGATVEDHTVSGDAMRSVPEEKAGELAEQHPCGTVIDSYSRAQAIADGVLVAAPGDLAAEAGFRLPVALTQAAWEDCVAWADEDSERQVPQDERGRLWDVLYMAAVVARRCRGASRMKVGLYRVPRGGHARAPRFVQLVAVIHAGDSSEPVLTIQQPNED